MKVKEVILGLVIAIVFLMFAVYGTKLIYDEPEYSDYCDKLSAPRPVLIDKTTADMNETEKAEYDAELAEYQAEMEKCGEEHDTARELYSRNMFLISLGAGVIVIVGSIVFINVGSVYGGLMFGSLMFIIYGTGSYWRYMNDLLRFGILGLALGLLIYAGYWLSKKEEMKKG